MQVKEVWNHFHPESDFGVRAKTKDEEIIYNLKSCLTFAGESLFVEIYSADTSDLEPVLICTREFTGVSQEERKYPSDKAIGKIFGGRKKAVANSYPILSSISKMTLEEYYAFVEENIGEY